MQRDSRAGGRMKLTDYPEFVKLVDDAEACIRGLLEHDGHDIAFLKTVFEAEDHPYKDRYAYMVLDQGPTASELPAALLDEFIEELGDVTFWPSHDEWRDRLAEQAWYYATDDAETRIVEGQERPYE